MDLGTSLRQHRQCSPCVCDMSAPEAQKRSGEPTDALPSASRSICMEHSNRPCQEEVLHPILRKRELRIYGSANE
jgi:hypothetical protein